MIRRRHPASALLVDPLVALTGCAVGTANTIDDAAYDKAPALPWPVTVTGLSGVDEVAPTRSISSRRPSATPPCRSSKRQAPSGTSSSGDSCWGFRGSSSTPRVDGASAWAVFWRIALPLSKPALVVTLVFEVQAVWTDLVRAPIYLRDSSTFTIPRGLKALVDASASAGNGNGN